MGKFVSILFLVICKISFAQTLVDIKHDSNNYVPECGKRIGYWVIKGCMQKDTAYAKDEKVEEGNYTDGLKTGIWTTFFPGGNKKSEITYVNNRPKGYAVFYFSNGDKQEEGNWSGTRWQGEYKRYFQKGILRHLFHYNMNGTREGEQIYYFENGKVNIDLNMKNGQEDGWKKEYDSNGNLCQETFYVTGVLDNSKTKIYAAPVYIKTKKDFLPGGIIPEPRPLPPPEPFTGEGQTTLCKNGQIVMKGNFHHWKLVDGEERIYDTNGFLVQIKIYKGGKYIADAPLPADENK